MSAPQEHGAVSSDGQHKGLSKFIRRASRALRSRSAASLRIDNESSQGQQTPSTSPAAPAREIEPQPTAASVAVGSTVTAPTVPTMSIAPTTMRFASMNVHRSGAPSAIQIPRPEIKDPRSLGKNQQEKAQMLFAKYGLTLDSSDWTAPTRASASEVQWVEKKIRVRVHRQCHHCNTSFGSTKECASCSHVRCKRCPRFPPKIDAATAAPPSEDLVVVEQQQAAAATAPVATPKDVEMGGTQEQPQQQLQDPVTDKENVAPTLEPTLESTLELPFDIQIDPFDQGDKMIQKATSKVHQRRGNDVVYRPQTHRVRRFCHKCETLFKGRSTACDACGHQRCPNCPRDPAKPMKYPAGYPGDVAEPEPLYPALERVWRKPRVRVRYTCEHCHTVFPSSGDRNCRECKHVRCAGCIRDPPHRSAREQPEELLKALEGKFVGLELLSAERAAAAGTSE